MSAVIDNCRDQTSLGAYNQSTEPSFHELSRFFNSYSIISVLVQRRVDHQRPLDTKKEQHHVGIIFTNSTREGHGRSYDLHGDHVSRTPRDILFFQILTQHCSRRLCVTHPNTDCCGRA